MTGWTNGLSSAEPRGATEVSLGAENGLARDCVADCDNLFTIPKRLLEPRRGALGPVSSDG